MESLDSRLIPSTSCSHYVTTGLCQLQSSTITDPDIALLDKEILVLSPEHFLCHSLAVHITVWGVGARLLHPVVSA